MERVCAEMNVPYTKDRIVKQHLRPVQKLLSQYHETRNESFIQLLCVLSKKATGIGDIWTDAGVGHPWAPPAQRQSGHGTGLSSKYLSLSKSGTGREKEM